LLLLNILNLEMTTDDNKVEKYVELLWRRYLRDKIKMDYFRENAFNLNIGMKAID